MSAPKKNCSSAPCGPSSSPSSQDMEREIVFRNAMKKTPEQIYALAAADVRPDIATLDPMLANLLWWSSALPDDRRRGQHSRRRQASPDRKRGNPLLPRGPAGATGIVKQVEGNDYSTLMNFSVPYLSNARQPVAAAGDHALGTSGFDGARRACPSSIARGNHAIIADLLNDTEFLGIAVAGVYMSQENVIDAYRDSLIPSWNTHRPDRQGTGRLTLDTPRRRLMLDAATRGANYLDSLETRPVFPREADVARLREALHGDMPAGPTPDAEVLAFLDDYGSPATVASAGGRYFGFVTGGALPATVASHMLAIAWDQNSFSFTSSPAAALFDEAALRWMKDIFGLPTETDRRVRARRYGGQLHRPCGGAARSARAGRLECRGTGPARLARSHGHRRRGSARHHFQDPAPARLRPRAARARAGGRPGAHARGQVAADQGPHDRLHPGGQCELRRVRSRARDHRLGACGRRVGARRRRIRLVGRGVRKAPSPDARVSSAPTPGRPTRTSG